MSLPNQTHPECRPGEVFLTNCLSIEPDDFDSIGYQTKRAGQIAYDTDGHIVSGYFPVFVWEVEYNSRHKETKIGQ